MIMCQRFNMQLLTVTSSEEQQDLRTSLLDNGMAKVLNNRFWIAGTDLHAVGEWTWMTNGQPMMPYSNWQFG